MDIHIINQCKDFDSYRAARVKSLFNAERGDTFELNISLPIEAEPWGLGLIVGPSGSGKTSIGKKIFGNAARIVDLYKGWGEGPIIDEISPAGDFNQVTGALANVGLGDVPAWLRPFKALSNGQQFRAGLARVICDAPDQVVIDEFTSVVDRQIAKIGAMAFAKGWRRAAKGKQAVLLSCHYDIVDWLQPDWVYDTGKGEFKKKVNSAPGLQSTWNFGRSITLIGLCLNRITI